jgi:hypothetical protein
VGGGGGGGGISGSPGSGVSGGGSLVPTVLSAPSGGGECVTILNFSKDNQENVVVLGNKFNVVENFITPTTAGVSVNNESHTLALDNAISLASISGINYTLNLTKITYLPIHDSVTVVLCGRVANSARKYTQTNVSTNGTSYSGSFSLSLYHGLGVNVKGLGVTAVVTSNSVFNSTEKVDIRPYNGTASIPGYTALTLFNITVTPPSNMLVTITQNYTCGTNQADLQPFMLVNGTWTAVKPFDVGTDPCTVTYVVPADPVAGLFAASNPTTIAATTAPTTTAPAKPSAPTNYTPVLAVIGIAIVAAVAYGYSRMPKRGTLGSR